MNMNNINSKSVPEEYNDICPIRDEELQEKMATLIKEPGFEHAIKYVMPDVNFDEFSQVLLNIKSKDEFQKKMMLPFLEMLSMKTADGISFSGVDNVDPGKAYTYITNHRDIVLDACFLNLTLLKNGISTSEVAIGNNLLIFEWIETLIKINKCFIVKRNLPIRQALDAAKQLSRYIHYIVQKNNESVWIAQREGRTKDSNDFTQESLVKMLGIAGDGNIVDRLMELNLMPVSLSYEFDPNDYLKAKEFLLKKRDPNFKKSQHDDLFSMETGILQYKGHIHFGFSAPINDQLAKIEDKDNKAETYKEVCRIIDNAIHRNYKIYPCNYIAYDKVYNTDRFKDKYTEDDIIKFNTYFEGQLRKVDIPDLTEEDYSFMREMMLKMYSNPLVNQLKAMEIE